MFSRIYNFIQNFEAILLSVVMVFCFFTPFAHAGWIQSAQYTIGTHLMSQPTNHTLKFKSFSGIDAPADTITVDLSGFIWGVVGVGDIDIFHGPITGLENIDAHAAVPGVGTWGISILGGMVTLTPPTDAAPGTVPANDYIVMRIGTNAVGGINRLTNPAVAQTIQINIGGNCGDQGITAQVITDDRVLVHGTILATTTTTTSPGGGGGCTEIPLISNLQAINITANSARITWDTSVNANSVVEYGLTNAYGDMVSNGDLVMSHAIDLTGLAPNTTYHYRARSISICGASNNTGDFTFTTLTDEPLEIDNLSCSNITDTGFNVIWDTNRPADSLVEFGKTPGLGSDSYSANLVTNHLLPLTSLDIGTTYYYRVISYDVSGIGATSTVLSCQTLPDQTPPTNVLFTAVPDCNSINLSWTHPAEPDFAGVRIVRKLGGYPTGPFDGDLVYDGLDFSVTDAGRTEGVFYYYAAYAYDTSGNFSSGSLASVAPVCPPQPIPPVPTTTPPVLPPVTPPVTPPVFPPGVTTTPILPSGPGCTQEQCGRITYDLYIINPDGTERHTGTNFVVVENIDPDTLRFGFEDKGDDMDYNDVVIDLQIDDCRNVEIEVISTSASWHHQIGLVIYYNGTVRRNGLVWPDTHTAIGQTLYYDAGGPGICEEAVTAITPQYYGAEGTLLLQPDPAGVRGVIAGESVLVRVPVANLGEQAASAIMVVNGQVYSLVLSPDGTEFTGTFPAPTSGTFTANITVNLVSGAIATAVDAFTVIPPGDVVEAELGLEITPVPGVVVTLYQFVNGEWVIWNGAPYGQENPALSDPSGRFIFHVPNGRYFAEVGKVGYVVERSPIMEIERNVFADHIALIKIPPPLILTTCKIDCSKVTYDLYIINPDGTERHMNTEYVEAVSQGEGVVLYRFEDKGLDFDYNDVLVEVDHSNCEHIKFLVSKTNARWHHQIRAKIFYEGEFRHEYILTYDSHAAYGKTLALDLTGNEELCEKEVTAFPQFEIIPLQMEFVLLSGLDFLQGLELQQQLEGFLMPVLLGISVLNLATALSLFNLLAYLQFIFTQPILLFGRLRKRRWGVVYNALSKQPVELAIVRLLHHETRLTVQTKVTDKEGRYIFKAKQGNYLIEVVKPQYEFPTEYLANEKDDAVFPNIYHGEVIRLDEDGIVALNIPLDPVQAVETPRKIVYRRLFKRIQYFVALFSVALSLVAFVISPTWFVGLVLIVQVGFYLIFRQLALAARAEPWGRVFDKRTNKPIAQAIVRIFDKKFNKLLDTQITNSQGRYGFFAEHNIYYITVEKAGYAKFTSQDLDLGSREETAIDLNVGLTGTESPKSK